MMSNYKYPLMLLAIIGYCLLLTGQQPERYLEIRGHAELEMNPLGNATATLYDGNVKAGSVQTSSDGSFSFKLEANKMYTVEVSKDGLVTKKISFNTALPDAESGVWVREFAIGLVVPCEGVDYSLLKKPVDIIKFNTRRRDFESDEDYVNKMMPELEEIYIKSENCLADKYDRLINQADKLFSQKTYEKARDTYQEALGIMPKEKYPQKKIDEINALLKEQESNDELYDNTIKEADALMAQQRYSEALTKYQDASALKPRETYTAKRINEIQTILQRQQAEEQSAAAAEGKYNDLIAKAAEAHERKNYDMAKQYYENASLIKPSESFPRNKILEIDALIKKQNQEKSRQESIDNAYIAAIAEADALFKAKKYDEAKEAYAKAISIKPSESYPRSRAQEIEKAIEQQAIDKQRTQAAELGRNLESYLDEGDRLYKAKDYEAARAAYAKALDIKPNEGYARQRINSIDKILASEQAEREKTLAEEQAAREKALAEQAAREKALAEQAAREKALAEQAAREKALVEQAAREKALAEQAAREKALAEQAAREKALAEQAAREKALAEQAAREKALAEQAAREKALAEQAAREKALAEQAAREKALAEQAAHEKALAEQAAREKALAEQAAREKALAEQAAREKALAEQAARQKAIDEGYKNAVTLANMAFTQKQYSSAREQYQKALTFKPDDVFARNKIEEVNRLIEEENKRLAAVELREKQYKDAIASADRLYQAKDHQGAISGYRQALNIKPGDTYAQQRITDIENAIAAERAERQRALAAEQAAREKALAEEQARKKKYDEVISKADNYFASEEYSNAKTSFGEALRIMPDETYPKQKIVEIDKILAELEKQKLANQARQKQYDNFISLGDKAFEGHNYTVAKGNYQKALNVIPDSPYPKQKLARIEEIEKLLAQQKAQTAQQTTVKSAGTQKIASAVPLAQLNFKDDTERDNYLNELKKKYPEGITVEIYKEKYRETRRYIVVRDNVASEFRDVLIKTYGGHEYTMNGKPVTQLYFGTQVKSRPGEYYKETIFE